jgi:hypothetical protein
MIDPRLTSEAVTMLKQGAAPDDVARRLIAQGAEEEEARAHVAELVRLKREAEALDPNRLRADALAMLDAGAGVAEVVRHFVGAGVAEPHAHAEAQRLAALKRCGRCGARMPPGDSYFDRVGNEICRRCNAGEEIAAAERRVVDADLEARGVPAFAIQRDNQVLYCPRCRDLTAVLEHATHFVGGDGGYGLATRTFRCTRCRQVVS